MNANSIIITSGFSKYVSSMIKGGSPQMYFVLGTGKESWDTSGVPTPSLNIDKLFNEVYRQRINMSTDVKYVDPETHEVVENEVTSTIRIEINFSNEFVSDIREYGIFAVDATDQLNSGTLIVYCNHEKITVPAGANFNKFIFINT